MENEIDYEKITTEFISKIGINRSTAQMIKYKSDRKIVLRVKYNDELTIEFSYEEIYDMLMVVARDKNNLHPQNFGQLRRMMTMIAGESHTDEILDYISKQEEGIPIEVTWRWPW